MTCAACAARIERTLNALDGVEASVNVATERAAVAYDPRQARLEDLLEAVAAAGYRARPASGATDEEARAPSQRRRLLL
ncbi:MAG: heavy-metal-associated domain-containing protein, partial [Gaiellaceae bacterium]|nr:heavy-metal-associated domain-containing protein [Gaiellaceae bacterium]